MPSMSFTTEQRSRPLTHYRVGLGVGTGGVDARVAMVTVLLVWLLHAGRQQIWELRWLPKERQCLYELAAAIPEHAVCLSSGTAVVCCQTAWWEEVDWAGLGWARLSWLLATTTAMAREPGSTFRILWECASTNFGLQLPMESSLRQLCSSAGGMKRQCSGS